MQKYHLAKITEKNVPEKIVTLRTRHGPATYRNCAKITPEVYDSTSFILASLILGPSFADLVSTGS